MLNSSILSEEGVGNTIEVVIFLDYNYIHTWRATGIASKLKIGSRGVVESMD